MNTQPLKLDARNFPSQVLEHAGVALVDFWAEWCGPCRAIAPVIEAVAAGSPDGTVVGKVDVDADPGLAAAHGVQSIPTLVFFRDGVEVHRLVGLASKGAIQEKLAELSQAAQRPSGASAG